MVKISIFEATSTIKFSAHVHIRVHVDVDIDVDVDLHVLSMLMKTWCYSTVLPLPVKVIRYF
jgi:hypothetical protein